MIAYIQHPLFTYYVFEDWNTYNIKSDTEEKTKAIRNENKLELENEDGRRNIFLYTVQCNLYSFYKRWLEIKQK